MSSEISPDQSQDLSTKDEVRKATRTYLLVGLILFCGTGVTVAIATIPWLDVGGHGFDRWDAMLGLGIASIKAILVATVFMHLKHERRLIYAIITLAGMHSIGMFWGTYWHYADMTLDSFFYHRTDSDYTTLAGAPEGIIPLKSKGREFEINESN
ncbi:MAG: cytochrome C oxidase subunit IV family protein [Verrucomicrobiota bacterium]